jgi:hypothetical protein
LPLDVTRPQKKTLGGMRDSELTAAALQAVSALCLSTCLTVTSSHADPAKARLGRLAWSAFVCATFAEISGQSNEHTRLSELGIESSRAFVDAYFSNQITEREASFEIPWRALDVLFGPSKDKNFIAGRLFESATQYAKDQVMKWDANETALPPDKWITDPSRQKSIAEDRFRTESCSLAR